MATTTPVTTPVMQPMVPTQPVMPPTQPVMQPVQPTLTLPDLGRVISNAPALPGQSLLWTGATDYAGLAAPPAEAIEASGALHPGWAEQRVHAIHGELLRTLFAEQRARVARIPLHVLSDRDVPNAAAGCSGAGAPMVVITSAMITVAAASAEARAHDELAGTDTLGAYATSLRDALRGRTHVPSLERATISTALAHDPRKLARTLQLFDAQLAFVLAHELAHHYRGHTGCAPTGEASASARDAEALQRGLAAAAPMLEQPFEVEADVWGVANVLERGVGAGGGLEGGGPWNEQGALLSLEVFRHLGPLASGRLEVAVFLTTHPPSELRAPVIVQAARMHRPGQPPLPTPTIDAQGIAIDLGGGPIRLPLRLPIAPPIASPTTPR